MLLVMLEDVPPHSDWNFLPIFFVFMHLMSSLDAIYAKDGFLCRSSIFLVISELVLIRLTLVLLLNGFLFLGLALEKLSAMPLIE